MNDGGGKDKARPHRRNLPCARYLGRLTVVVQYAEHRILQALLHHYSVDEHIIILRDSSYPLIPTASMEGPNPLRPYYIPPSVGPPPDFSQDHTSTSNVGSKYAASASATTSSFGSSARNILADMDYTDYLSESSPSPADIVKRLLEQALWKYTSIFLAQPFEVAKTVLQVQHSNIGQKAIAQAGPADDPRRRLPSHSNDLYEVISKETYAASRI